MWIKAQAHRHHTCGASSRYKRFRESGIIFLTLLKGLPSSMKMSLSRSAFPFPFPQFNIKAAVQHKHPPQLHTASLSWSLFPEVIVLACGCVCVHLSKRKKKEKKEKDEEKRDFFFGPGLWERVEGQAWRWCLWWWWWWQEEHQRSEPLNLPGESPVETALISARCRSNSGLNVLCSWNGARITEGLMTLFPSPGPASGWRKQWNRPFN